MKYLLTLLLGVIFGAALAVTGLYFNPLPARAGATATADSWRLGYVLPSDDTLLLAHGQRRGLPLLPQRENELWEATVRGVVLHATMLHEADGPAAVASRASVPSADRDLLRRGLLTHDQWIITVPGQGSLLVQAESNLWPLLRDHIAPVWYLGRHWRGPAVLHPTVGPGARGRARLRGVTGSFAGRDGEATETLLVEDVLADGPALQLHGELHLRLTDPQPD